ncbi:hypothetical protein A3Q56_03867 [Intoshia linei]|uniref:Tyrosine-protein kinase n=1 Tax=Intoshia linei TaxID=1819745 RepID=A0A177B2A6_9BILA|nr:hypothetical protein A3Q56_03867 [Intoshia linei]
MPDWKPGTILLAIKSYTHRHKSNFLKFYKDELIEIITKKDEITFLGTKHNHNDQGMCYLKYFTEFSSSEMKGILFSFMSRKATYEALQPLNDGKYLIRQSNNYPGDLTLSVSWNKNIEHYRIKRFQDAYTIDDDEYFTDLCKLIKHYEKDADGLCTNLLGRDCEYMNLPAPSFNESSIKQRHRSDYSNSKLTLCSSRINDIVVNYEDVEIGAVLGKGEYSEVFKGKFNQLEVAIKIFKDNLVPMTQKLKSEAYVMMNLKHINLIKLIGVVTSPKNIIIIEYMPNGSILDFLRSRGRYSINKDSLFHYSVDTCSGLEYIESKSLVHRDIAARNILLSKEFIAKISDFGLAISETNSIISEKLPVKWTAPEALRLNKFSNKSDVWSFGVLLWEFYSYGKVPYRKIPVNGVIKALENGFRMDMPVECPQDIYKIMQSCWEIDPDTRPTFKNLLHQLKSL